MNIFSSGIKYLRSLYLTKRYKDEGTGHIKMSMPFVNIKIRKQPNSKLTLNGKLIFGPHFGGRTITTITLGKNAQLIINGDFVLGDGLKIFVADNAQLVIGGRLNEPTSGITSNSLIMVYKKIIIGKDFLCSWNAYITDCDWHSIEGKEAFSDVTIGDHVWVGNNCSILKGSTIGDNVVVTSYTKVINKEFKNGVMIGGVPATVIKEKTSWSYFF